MKKLLLLLLLAPNLIQAEELNLVCEGIATKPAFTTNREFYIKATDETIEMLPYSLFKGYDFIYKKDKDLITVNVKEKQEYNDGYCTEYYYSLVINRMSGTIYYEYDAMNPCEKTYHDYGTFKGTCKKQERAF
jgi:hypothetical protein